MKMLDFNTLQQPTWQIKLRDEAKTVVNLVAPDTELVDRLVAAAPQMQEVAQAKDGRTIRAVFELIADLMSCNDDGYTFTAEELRDRYKMTLIDAIRFISGYMTFIQEMGEAKN